MMSKSLPSNKEIKASARKALKGKWGISILVCFLYFCFTASLNIGMSINKYINSSNTTTPSSSSGSLIVSIINLFIAGAFSFGICHFFLNILNEKETRVSDLFRGFKHYGGTFIANLLVTIYTILWFILFSIPASILIISALVSTGGGLTSLNITSIIIIALVILLVSVIFSIVILRYSMTYFIYADNPEIGGVDAIKESVSMMKGNCLKLFTLMLSFIGWGILACLTVVGILFLIPYINASLAAFYEELKEDEEDIEVIDTL
ncbi:DUF975 family protein [Hathewaya histolytica]|nr:DUF975 family protein [Hathewaya histolytica]